MTQGASPLQTPALNSVLVVEDRDVDRELLATYVEIAGFPVVQASTGAEALATIERFANDLAVVLLDLHMPRISGYEVLRVVRSDSARDTLPIVVTTADDQRDARRRAAALGADEFLAKPVDQIELTARLRHLVRVRNLSRRMVSMQSILDAFSAAIERRDKYTNEHGVRVAAYAVRVAEELGLPPAERLQVLLGAQIRDIGMVAIPDRLLHHPGPLSDEERAIVKQHVAEGVRICAHIPSSSTVVQIVRYHHERYDGTGYLERLRGEAIPLAARIVGVCDAFDAITSDRPYRPRNEWNDAYRMLSEGSGTQWDPVIVSTLQHVLTTDSGLVEAVRIGGTRLQQMLTLWRDRLVRHTDLGPTFTTPARESGDFRPAVSLWQSKENAHAL